MDWMDRMAACRGSVLNPAHPVLSCPKFGPNLRPISEEDKRLKWFGRKSWFHSLTLAATSGLILPILYYPVQGLVRISGQLAQISG